MAAGLATLERLTPALYADLEAKGAAWAAAFEEIPGLCCPRKGSLLWPLFQEPVRRADAVQSAAVTQFNRFHKLMLDQGIYLAPSGYEVGFLSAAHSEAELADFRAAVAAVAPSFN